MRREHQASHTSISTGRSILTPITQTVCSIVSGILWRPRCLQLARSTSQLGSPRNIPSSLSSSTHKRATSSGASTLIIHCLLLPSHNTSPTTSSRSPVTTPTASPMPDTSSAVSSTTSRRSDLSQTTKTTTCSLSCTYLTSSPNDIIDKSKYIFICRFPQLVGCLRLIS